MAYKLSSDRSVTILSNELISAFQHFLLVLGSKAELNSPIDIAIKKLQKELEAEKTRKLKSAKSSSDEGIGFARV